MTSTSSALCKTALPAGRCIQVLLSNGTLAQAGCCHRSLLPLCLLHLLVAVAATEGIGN
jgi:hypothetical protein